jgi:hypothetical protein
VKYFGVQYHHINIRAIVISGNVINRAIISNSIVMRNVKTIMSTIIKADLMIIPTALEKPMSPSLYSFFNGLKNVLRKSVNENASLKAPLSERKKPIISAGASQNQNFRNKNGSRIEYFICRYF